MVTVLQGDAETRLREIPDGSVSACITSPPYFGLRDYGTALWEGGDENCDHSSAKAKSRYDYPMPESAQVGTHKGMKPGTDGARWKEECPKCGARRVDQQIGLEESVEAHVARLVAVFREVRRVLHPSGCLLLNYGDAYHNLRTHAGGGMPGQSVHKGEQRNKPAANCARRSMRHEGIKDKDLLELPSEVVRALRADGWWLRSRIPWLKRSAMPESVTDRPTTAVEYWFLLTRQSNYYWDSEAIRRKNTPETVRTSRYELRHPSVDASRNDGDSLQRFASANGRNFRNSDLFHDSLSALAAWHRQEAARLEHLRENGGVLTDAEGNLLALDINTQAYSEAHFATFAEALIRPLVLASTPEAGCCAACGAPRTRVVEKEYSRRESGGRSPAHSDLKGYSASSVMRTNALPQIKQKGWQSSCSCAADTRPAVVLDCFAGSGTTLRVAELLGRDSIGIELSQQYVELIRKRIDVTPAIPGLWE